MSTGELSERARQVLQALLFEYTVTAEPVGSRQVAKKHALGLSPATIRNTMADLEEMGYLAQPHTSAGRVPTDKAYRYYVDSLMGRTEIGRPDAHRLQRQVSVRGQDRRPHEATSAQLSSSPTTPPSSWRHRSSTRGSSGSTSSQSGDRAIVVLATERMGMSRILAFEVGAAGRCARSPGSSPPVALTFQEIGAGWPRRAPHLSARASRRRLRGAVFSLWDRNLYVGSAMNMLDQRSWHRHDAALQDVREKRQLIELPRRVADMGDVQVVIGLRCPSRDADQLRRPPTGSTTAYWAFSASGPRHALRQIVPLSSTRRAWYPGAPRLGVSPLG
jgi:hypothetical protein